jgi:hypothetical protein
MATADLTMLTTRADRGGRLTIDISFCPPTRSLSDLVKSQATAEKPDSAVLIKSWKNPFEPTAPNVIALARFRWRTHYGYAVTMTSPDVCVTR